MEISIRAISVVVSRVWMELHIMPSLTTSTKVCGATVSAKVVACCVGETVTYMKVSGQQMYAQAKAFSMLLMAICMPVIMRTTSATVRALIAMPTVMFMQATG